MKVILAGSRLELRKNQLLCMEGARDTRIVCVDGELWITQHEDQRDLVVPAGGCFTLDRDGIAVISALQASSVWLREPTRAKSPASSPGAAFWRKVIDWMRTFDLPAIELRGR
jgi:hypothetical protein